MAKSLPERQATLAQVKRVTRAAEEMGHTVHGIIVQGQRIEVRLQPYAGDGDKDGKQESYFG